MNRSGNNLNPIDTDGRATGRLRPRGIRHGARTLRFRRSETTATSHGDGPAGPRTFLQPPGCVRRGAVPEPASDRRDGGSEACHRPAAFAATIAVVMPGYDLLGCGFAITPDRSGPGSSPWSRPRRSPGRTSPVRPRRRRLRPGLVARRWSRRPDRCACRST